MPGPGSWSGQGQLNNNDDDDDDDDDDVGLTGSIEMRWMEGPTRGGDVNETERVNKVKCQTLKR